MSKLVQNAWVDIVLSVFPKTNITLTGESPTDATRPAIILANHQVDADWWYIWLAARDGCNSSSGGGGAAGNIKICLKNELKYVPIVGWGMRMFDFLFLQRNFNHDQTNITNHMKSFVADHFPYWFVLFPEGTTIHQEYVTKSQTFAEKTNRVKLEKVLLPRSQGLCTVLSAIQSELAQHGDQANQDVPDIYDMTIGYNSYSGEIPTYDMGYGREVDRLIPSMKSLLAGRNPQAVHIHTVKYAYADVIKYVDNPQQMENFLDQLWLDKEKKLKEFTHLQRFPTEGNERILKPQASLLTAIGLWASLVVLFFVLPVFVMLFFPCYLLWIGWTMVYNYGMNFWWPYLVNLITEKNPLAKKYK